LGGCNPGQVRLLNLRVAGCNSLPRRGDLETRRTTSHKVPQSDGTDPPEDGRLLAAMPPPSQGSGQVQTRAASPIPPQRPPVTPRHRSRVVPRRDARLIQKQNRLEMARSHSAGLSRGALGDVEGAIQVSGQDRNARGHQAGTAFGALPKPYPKGTPILYHTLPSVRLQLGNSLVTLAPELRSVGRCGPYSKGYVAHRAASILNHVASIRACGQVHPARCTMRTEKEKMTSFIIHDSLDAVKRGSKST
jgi:hypothetical protein